MGKLYYPREWAVRVSIFINYNFLWLYTIDCELFCKQLGLPSTEVVFALLTHLPQVRLSVILDVADIYWCLEERGQGHYNVDRTHLVLAS